MDLNKLTKRFRKQQAFSADYSPLYACLFGTLADWLDQGDDKPLINWLLAAAESRNPLDVTLLLMAGLHRDILEGVPEVVSLARYYATAGGDMPWGTPDFERDLREAIMARQESLTTFIQNATVQTNETGRGIAWLLPLLYTGWEAIHLVDLGASAGLNLVAEKRAYRLRDEQSGKFLIDVGDGKPVQFQVECRGDANHLLAAAGRIPFVASRSGCDIAPFLLKTADDELTLAAYIWADQVARFQRLHEGIAALHKTNREGIPVRLHAVNLPGDLPQFLNRHIPAEPPHPVLIYNTYMIVYLADKGADLRQHIQEWAITQARPILWLQWEPAWEGPKPPEYGWCAWTADLWRGKDHQRWQLGWVHPHGTHVRWEPGFQDWVDYWNGL